jgi:hypothetical protein
MKSWWSGSDSSDSVAVDKEIKSHSSLICHKNRRFSSSIPTVDNARRRESKNERDKKTKKRLRKTKERARNCNSAFLKIIFNYFFYIRNLPQKATHKSKGVGYHIIYINM